MVKFERMNEIESLFYQRIWKTIGVKGLRIEKDEYTYTVKRDKDEIGMRFDYEIEFEYYFKIRKISGSVYLIPQHRVGKYILDFLFSGRLQTCAPSLAIEIDGHEWHEKTKNQAMKDKKRDRDILMAMNPTPTVRYTGSEIYNNKKAPYLEVLEYPVRFCIYQMMGEIEESEPEETIVSE